MSSSISAVRSSFVAALLLGVGLTLLGAPALAAQTADALAIRAARSAQNEAIARGELDTVSSFWTDDITVRRALGSPVAGRAAARAAFEPPAGVSPTATSSPRLVYLRLSNDVDVSTHWPLAFESGVWEGREGTRDGPVLIGGRFSAQWVKRDGRWLIRSEVFVALTCAGAGCSLVAVP